jgi:hypothetical protein
MERWLRKTGCVNSYIHKRGHDSRYIQKPGHNHDYVYLGGDVSAECERAVKPADFRWER